MDPAGAAQARCKYCGANLGDWANPHAHIPDCPYPAEQARLAQHCPMTTAEWAGMTNAYRAQDMGKFVADFPCSNVEEITPGMTEEQRAEIRAYRWRMAYYATVITFSIISAIASLYLAGVFSK